VPHSRHSSEQAAPKGFSGEEDFKFNASTMILVAHVVSLLSRPAAGGRSYCLLALGMILWKFFQSD